MQGSEFQGFPTLQAAGADPSNYTLESYTWDFPTGALKGYGTFRPQHEREGASDPGNYYEFTGNPTGVPAPGSTPTASAQTMGFTSDDLNYESNIAANANREENDHVDDSFYWGPEAEGVEVVRLSATYVKLDSSGNVLDTFSGDDSVTFIVIRPEGSGAVDNMGTPNVTSVTTVNRNGEVVPQTVELGTRYSAPRVPGISYHTSVSRCDADGGAITGSFVNIQTMYTLKLCVCSNPTTGKGETWQADIFKDADGNLMVDPNSGKVLASAASEPVLDSSRSYEAANADPSSPFASVFYYGRPDATVGPGATASLNYAQVGTTIYGNDSPASPVPIPFPAPNPIWFGRADFFSIYVMYNPNPQPDIQGVGGTPNSIWIPVGRIDWNWAMSVVRQNGVWVPSTISTASPGAYQDNTTFPTWDRTITDVNKNVVKL